MSRSSLGFRRSFNTGRKLSRKDGGTPQQRARSEHSEMHEKRQRSRHDNSEAEKATRSIFGDVPLTDTERRYLWAAQSGNLPALEMLVEEAGTFNLSCRDYLGRTALQLAVLGEHYDCIQLLLEKSRMDVIEEGLLHAIKTENVKICDMFLGHPVYSDPRSRLQLDFHHGFYEQEDNSSSFAPDITPVVLAAQCNNFDIVHMLIQKGFTIPTPHNYFCFCTECYNHKNFDRVVHSKSRLNAYRGLASTAYLSLSCDDPIHAAFELSRSLQKLAEREKEHKNEYRGLSDKCKNFAVDLLDQCRTNEEVMAALHGGTDTRDLMRIKMAIRYEQKKFIAHASCQEHLASMWYAGAPWFQHQNFPIKLVLVPLGIMFIPVTAIVYVFLPYSRIGKILKSPFMKFMNYICSYTAFLVLLFLGTQLSSFKSVHLFNGTEGVVNGLIMFYVLGMFWAECKQLWEEGVKGYFSQMWNYMDITMLALYTAGYSTEGVIYTKTRGYDADNNLIHSEDSTIINPQILSKILFSVANVMSFARIAYILPASETFGQLQISYGRMLQDVAKFIFIYFTVMIAFICGLTSLYSISNNEHFSGLSDTTGTLFWAAFGMGNSKAPQIVDPPTSGGGNTGHSDQLQRGGVDVGSAEDQAPESEVLAMVEVVGYMLYGVYILGAVVVLINMLIAMMSNTFEEIQKSEDSEWKFARAKLWISFIEQGTTLPIPFNIIPTPKSILKLCRWFRACMNCDNSNSDDGGENTEKYEMEYKAIMHRVVLRYIHKMKFEKKGDSLKDDIMDTREEVVYQLHTMYGRLSSRLDLLERDVFCLSNPGAIAKSSPGGVSRRSSPGLSYSRSVSSHMAGSRDRIQNLRAADSDLNLHAQDGLDLLFNRRSRYSVRPSKDPKDRSGRSSLKDSGQPGASDRKSESTPDVEGAEEGIGDGDVTSGGGKANLSDGDKRIRKSGIAHCPPPCSSVSSAYTDISSRKESLASVISQSLSDPDQYLMRRGGSIRVRSDREESFSPRPGSERRRRRTDGLRDSRKSDNFTSAPVGHRWGQGVIKESSMEDQLTGGDRETSFSNSRVSSIARSPLLRGSGKRRETYNHPNIDAPFGLPHRAGRDSSSSNKFTEYHETRPQTRDAIQSLVLDVQQVPFTQLEAKDGRERWTGEAGPEDDHTGSLGSVFMSSPPGGPAGKKYGRQDSQTSISTIGRLAAAATARVFPMEVKGQTEHTSGPDSVSNNSQQQCLPKQVKGQETGIAEKHRVSDTSSASTACPATIVTMSGNADTSNVDSYPLSHDQTRTVSGNTGDLTGHGKPESFSRNGSVVTERSRADHGTSCTHQDFAPDSRTRGHVIEDRYSCGGLPQTSTCNSGPATTAPGAPRTGNACGDRSCVHCSALELEPLSLSQTEYVSSSFTPGQKLGHVNHVYLPETPPTPTSETAFYPANQRDSIRNQPVFEEPRDNVATGATSTDDLSLSETTRHSKAHIHFSSSATQHPLAADRTLSHNRNDHHVQFDQRQILANPAGAGQGTKQHSSQNETTLPLRPLLYATTERVCSNQPLNMLDPQNASTQPVYHSQSSVYTTASSPITPTATSSILAGTLEEHYFSDSHQDLRHHQQEQRGRMAEGSRDKGGAAPERHFSDCQPYQRIAGRYRKRVDSGVPYNKHPASFSGTVASKHHRALHHHHSRESLLTPATLRYMQHSNDHEGVTDIKFNYQHDNIRTISEPHPSYHHHNSHYRMSHQNQPHLHHQDHDQDEQQELQQQQQHQQQQEQQFSIFPDTSPLHSPEVGVSTAAAMFIPAMATNLLPFPLPIQSSAAFSHKPISKQQAKHAPADTETGAETDKPSGEASSTPRKKKTSLVSFVRGRRSDKSKDKSGLEGKHNRSLSLNRSSGSKKVKLLTLQHQRSKEI